MNGKMAKLFLVGLILAAGGMASAQDLWDMLDFSITMKELSEASGSDEELLALTQGKVIVLEGAVASITEIDGNQETFTVLVELMNGEWVGLEDVLMFRCYVLFGDPYFHGLFSSDTPEPRRISLNDHVLVLGYADSIYEGVPLIIGLDARVIP